MYNRIAALFALRDSTAFLLHRADDRLLQDIGLTRSDLEAMHLGLPQTHAFATAARHFALWRKTALPA